MRLGSSFKPKSRTQNLLLPAQNKTKTSSHTTCPGSAEGLPGVDQAPDWVLSRYSQSRGEESGDAELLVGPPPFGTGLRALTHRRGGQGLAAHKLRRPHAAQEVTELRVRCQADPPIVKAARRKNETKTKVPGAD